MRSYGATYLQKRFSAVFPETNCDNQQKKLSFRRALGFALLLLVALAISGSMPGQVALASSTLSFSTTSASFGSVAVGSSAAVSVLITNTGSSSVTLSGDSSSASWCTVSGVSLPATIAAGAYRYATIKFAPTSAGVFSGYVTFTSNASNSSVRYTVSGTGVAKGIVAMTPESVSFGAVATGVTNSQTVQLKNTGTASLTISSAVVSGTGFKLSGVSLPLTLAPAQTSNVTVSFEPTSSGTSSGSVVVTSTALDAVVSIALSGTGGTATKTLTLSNSSLNFGSQLVGALNAVGVTVKNTGNSSITISGLSVTGSGFSIGSSLSGTTIAGGQSAEFSVVFDPKTTGSASGTVTLTSNASNPTISMAVSGNGISSSGHAVTIEWSRSTSNGVSGYYVYRSTTSGGPYARVSGAATTGLQYLDSSVSAGMTYYYVVTALGTNGEESPLSTQVVAQIP